MSSAATSSLRRLLFTSPLGHDGGKEDRYYVRFLNGCWNSDSTLDHESSNLVGEITRVLYKEEEAHPFIKSLLIGSLNEFSRIAGHLERLKLKPNASRRDHR